jgi:undecaprenyl diphosphate synthase
MRKNGTRVDASPSQTPRDLAVAIIMDGNGRWADQRGLSVTEGHRAGGTALRRTVEAALDLGVAELTVYAFSTENWSRSPDEVRGIMQLFVELLEREVPDLHEQGVHMGFIGRREGLADPILECMEWAERTTADNDRLKLVIAFNYGGRAEIVDAAQSLVEDGRPITEEAISATLYTSRQRDPDLIIRTAGEHRISNFLIWQGAYAELVFSDVLWPDFGHDELASALGEYARRERRFGGRLATATGGETS